MENKYLAFRYHSFFLHIKKGFSSPVSYLQNCLHTWQTLSNSTLPKTFILVPTNLGVTRPSRRVHTSSLSNKATQDFNQHWRGEQHVWWVRERSESRRYDRVVESRGPEAYDGPVIEVISAGSDGLWEVAQQRWQRPIVVGLRQKRWRESPSASRRWQTFKRCFYGDLSHSPPITYHSMLWRSRTLIIVKSFATNDIDQVSLQLWHTHWCICFSLTLFSVAPSKDVNTVTASWSTSRWLDDHSTSGPGAHPMTTSR